MKKLLIAMTVLSSLTLAACGDDKDKAKEKEQEQVQKVEVDYTESASAYKAAVMPVFTSFVEDATLLQTYVQEGKLEEATKLYPLVHMYIERLKPLESQFKEQLEKIDGDREAEDVIQAGGLHAIETALFEKQDASLAVDAAANVVTDLTTLTNELAKTTIDGESVLKSTAAMLKNSVDVKLSKEVNLSNSQVYDVQANLEAITQVKDAFSNQVDAEQVKALQMQLDATLEAVAYYEVGKEDYVNYSFFTNKQKEELIDSFNKLTEQFNTFAKSIK